MEPLFNLAAGSLFPEPHEIFWTLVNFTVLLAVLYKFLYKPLLGAISEREEQIESALKKAATDRTEAERLRKDFELKIAEAHREAQEIVAKANKTATTVKEEIEGDARARASEILENATKTIEREKMKALAELRAEVANLAIAVAGKVIEKNLDTTEQRRLADSFVAEVGNN